MVWCGMVWYDDYGYADNYDMMMMRYDDDDDDDDYAFCLCVITMHSVLCMSVDDN